MNTGEFPFIVSLQEREYFNGYHHKCGGSIITHHTVLTAAHCVWDVDANQLRVVAGTLYWNNEDKNGQIRKVTHFVAHKDYEYNPYFIRPNDVALLFVEEPFHFNAFVHSIPLANPQTNESARFAVVAGWGNTQTWPLKLYPNVMQTEELSLMSHAECVEQTEKERLNLTITESMLCAGPLKKNFGPCHGDSGGPLVQNGTLIGIVSWISGPCGYSLVSGFTRVSSFRKWILGVDSRVRHYNSTGSSYDDLGVYQTTEGTGVFMLVVKMFGVFVLICIMRKILSRRRYNR